MMIKKLMLFLVLSFVIANVNAQITNPVKWSYSVQKKADKVYNVVLTATLVKPWHIYSQFTPEGGPVPTSITFKNNPLVVLDGKAKENGSLKTDHDENFGVDVKYFADKVEFIQTVKLRSNAKTSVSGTVEYMVCNDNKCLPPAKQNFAVTLQ